MRRRLSVQPHFYDYGLVGLMLTAASRLLESNVFAWACNVVVHWCASQLDWYAVFLRRGLSRGDAYGLHGTAYAFY